MSDRTVPLTGQKQALGKDNFAPGQILTPMPADQRWRQVGELADQFKQFNKPSEDA